jgi:hypothetical protein
VEVAWALLADYANVDASNKINILGVFRDLNIQKFPYELPSMHLVATLEALPVEVGSIKDIRVTLLDADAKNQLYNQQLSLPVGAHPLASRGSMISFQLLLQLTGVVFKNPGDYQFNILVGGEPKKTMTLIVREAPQPTG